MNTTGTRIPVQFRDPSNRFVPVELSPAGDKEPAPGSMNWKACGGWPADDPRLEAATYIALVLGEQYVDVDCDNKDGKQGSREFWRLWAESQPESSFTLLPATTHIATMNGGEAWVFLQAPEDPVPYRILGRRGCLEIRAGNGKARYRVIAGPGYDCTGPEPAGMPEMLRKAVEAAPSGSQGSNGSAHGGDFHRAGMNSATVAMVKMMADSGAWSEDEAAVCLVSADATLPDPMGASVVESIVRRCWHESPIPEGGTEWMQRESVPEADRPETRAAKYESVDWAKAWAEQPEDIDWLFEPMLERGTLNSLYALAGCGKSLLAENVALTIVRSGGTVVYVDQENRVKDHVDRLQDMGATPEELGRFRLYSFPQLPALDTPAGGADLAAIALRDGADLVILDTTMRMVDGHENDADTFNGLYRHSLLPLKRAGITVLRLDHPGKDIERGQRGSSAKGGDVDTVWKMTEKTKGLLFGLEREKGRSNYECSSYAVYRRTEPLLRHDWEAPLSPDDQAVTDLLQKLSSVPVSELPLSAGRDTVRKYLGQRGQHVSTGTLTRAIKLRKLSSRHEDS